MLSAEELVGAARRGDEAAVASLLTGATEQERLALGKPVEAAIKAMQPEDWWRSDPEPSGAFGLAVLGTTPSASRGAALLGRRFLRSDWGDFPIPRVLDVVRARGLPWLDDLAQRLAGKLAAQDAWGGGWRFVSALLIESGGTPPLTEGVVRGWLFDLREGDDDVSYADRLRASPHLDLLLPAVFEIDGLGNAINGGDWGDNGWDPTPTFPGGVAALVAAGRLERKTILDLTVDRLVRGDRQAFLRPFVLLHDLLAPGVDEMSGHALDYARLLPDAPSSAAGVAQRALRAVDDAGLLELDTLLDASRPTLLRKEKGLVKAQLSWLDRVAGRESGRAAEVVETIGVAFGHPALDVQSRALTLVERRASALDAGTLARLADLASGLGGDLPGRAATLLGTVAPAAPQEAVASSPPPGPAEMPAPIASTAELAEEIVALLHDETAVRWERVMAGLVTLRGEDMSALRQVADRHLRLRYYQRRWARIFALDTAVQALVDPQEPGATAQALVDPQEPGATLPDGLMANLRAAWSGSDRYTVGSPDRLLELRLAELAVLITARPVGELLATPTHVNGSLDASVLVERLRRAEAHGWHPWPLDLEQALLRVPRGTDPSVAAGLASDAGRQLAAWLAGGGLADPVSTRQDQVEKRDHHRIDRTPLVNRVVVGIAPDRPGRAVSNQIITLARGPWWTAGNSTWIRHLDMLTAATPHHREVSAAWALSQLSLLAIWDQRGDEPFLPLLAECDGPFGPAMSLAMVYVLAARHETDRVSAVDAFLTLAARDEPFAATVGGDLGDLAARGIVKLGRAVAPLTDAHRAGASAAVWELLAAALPPLLPSAPRGLPDLLELASQVAAAVGARDEVPGLSGLAAKKGSSRLLQEARRLRSVLTSSPSR